MAQTLRDEVSNQIKRHRIKNIAEEIGLHHNTFSMWLAGKLEIGSEKKEKIRKYFDIEAPMA